MKSKYDGSRLIFHDGAGSPRTSELGVTMAPVVFQDDFLGKYFDGKWETVETSLNTAIASAEEVNGILLIGLDADDNAEQGVLYWGDDRGISVKQEAIFECRCMVSVLPTTGVDLVIGMAGDHNATRDNMTEAAWFRCQASGALLCESDDTTNNNDDVATGTTLVATDWHTLRIDFTDIADVKFYLDNVRVCATTTFDMSNLTDDEAVLQPYIGLGKSSGTGVGSIKIDWVRITSRRS
jgi:hypothetical protein